MHTPTLAVLSRSWNGEPVLLLTLILPVFLYWYGLLKLSSGAGRGPQVGFWQMLAFAGGWVSIFVALVSPLDEMARNLFSMHMVQHLLLMLIAPPLFVASAPWNVFWFVLPAGLRQAMENGWKRSRAVRRAWESVTRPAAAWLFNAGVLWAWQFPRLQEAALENESVHALEHACLLAAGFIFWWTLLQTAAAGRKLLALGPRVLYLFSTVLESSGLGVLLAFSTQLWYAGYSATVPGWPLSPLEDQQLAGLVIWVPGGVIYLVAAAALFVLWLNALERDVREKDLARMQMQATPELIGLPIEAVDYSSPVSGSGLEN